MWGVLLLSTSSPSAEPSFSEQYERGYNTFNPASRYAPDNPLNPGQAISGIRLPNRKRHARCRNNRLCRWRLSD